VEHVRTTPGARAAPAQLEELTAVELRRDPGCFRDLTWGCNQRDGTGPRVDLEAVAALLARGPFELHRRLGKILYLHHGAGHVIVLVPATGRIQIRLHYLTGDALRPAAAYALAAVVDAAVRQQLRPS